jgi:hypothetical protein
MLGANMEPKILRVPDPVPKGQRPLRVGVNQERRPGMLGHITSEMRSKGALSGPSLAGRKNHDIHASFPSLDQASMVAQGWLTEPYR